MKNIETILIISITISLVLTGYLFGTGNNVMIIEENSKLKLENKNQIARIQELTDSLNMTIIKLGDSEYKYVLESSRISYFWDAIAKIESSNGLFTTGDNGKAKGDLQLHAGAVIDVNKYYNTKYSHDDMYDRDKAIAVGSMYLNLNAKRFMKNYAKLPSEEMLARMWNGGYGGFNSNSTLGYKIKFNKIFDTI